MWRKIIYLTIDDWPTWDMKEKVDFLNSKWIKAIWFCEWRNLKRYPSETIYAIRNGHIIWNHSYNHPHFGDIPIKEIKNQIEKTDKLIEELYKKSWILRTMKLCRFPYLDNWDKKWYLNTDWKDSHVKAIQNVLKELWYVQPKFENINYEWFNKAWLNSCLNVDCTYDSFDWCLEEWIEMFGYSDLKSILSRMDENYPENGRGLNYSGSNDIVMMHSWIDIDDFKVLINKMMDKIIIFDLPKNLL